MIPSEFIEALGNYLGELAAVTLVVLLRAIEKRRLIKRIERETREKIDVEKQGTDQN